MKLLVKRNIFIFFFISIIVAFIVGNRGDTRDTFVYLSVFKFIDNYNLLNPKVFYQDTGMEIGFGWYSYIISLFTTSPFILFFTFSLLTFIFVYKVGEEVKAPFLPMITLYLSSGYFFLQQFMQIRQALAIPIALLAVALFVRNNNKLNLSIILLSIFSVSFHQSVFGVIFFGFLLSFFINKINWSLLRFKIFLFFMFITIFLLAKYILVDVLMSISSRVEAYSESEYAEAVGLFRLPNIKAILTLFILIAFMDKNLYKNKIFTIFTLLFVVGVGMRLGFADFGILSGRFAVSFTYTEIYILPFIFRRFGVLGLLGLVLFIIFQAIATYYFQAPYIFEDYFRPLGY